MMNYYFITGTSRGIGKAFAELLLKDKSNIVYGLSRSNNLTGDNYKHTFIDLSDLEALKKFEFTDLPEAKSIALVNNSASTIGIRNLGKLTSDEIINAYNINIVSSTILMNNFLNKYQLYDCKRSIMNISSGAAYKPMESWSVYCATKAALAMISEVADVEQKLKFPENSVRIYSVEPGIVDTQMQADLRKVSPEDFSMVGMFIDFFEKKELAGPEDIAEKLDFIIQNPERFDKAAINVKEID